MTLQHLLNVLVQIAKKNWKLQKKKMRQRVTNGNKTLCGVRDTATKQPLGSVICSDRDL
jgi:hypothetical protein